MSTSSQSTLNRQLILPHTAYFRKGTNMLQFSLHSMRKLHKLYLFLIGFAIIYALMCLGLLLGHKRPINTAAGQNIPQSRDFALSSLPVEPPNIAPNPSPDAFSPELEALIRCESGGRLDAINRDDGKIGVHSYGILQFQLATALYYNDKFKVLPDLEDGEIMNIVYDQSFQRKLAAKILEEKGGWRNWYICGKKVGLDKL